MPQIDVDYYEDILYVGFLSFLFDGGVDDVEEGVVQFGIELFLAQFYLTSVILLSEEKRILTNLSFSYFLKQKVRSFK